MEIKKIYTEDLQIAKALIEKDNMVMRKYFYILNIGKIIKITLYGFKSVSFNYCPCDCPKNHF